MARRRTWVALAVTVLAAAASAAWVAFPARTTAVVRSAYRLLDGVPDPVLLGVALVATTLVWLATVYLLAKLCYRLWARVRGRVRWLAGKVLPQSPLVKFATGVMVLVVVVVVIVAVLPAVIDIGGEGDSPAGYAQELGNRTLNAEWDSIVDGDTVGGNPACRDRTVEGPDSDGDGLPDRWEQAGETPEGASLPDADPAHKDLYVQLNHGTNVDPLTPEERDQLRAVWARMPVANPDGTTGIDIHLVDSGPGGSLGESAVFTTEEGTRRYYTAERLGSRHCVYHQTTYGRLEMGDVVGRGEMPGYATIVDGRRQSSYAGNVSFRVAVTTHELLHNVAGRVGGRSHTSSGWLTGGPNDEYLSRATARDLNETGLFGPV